MSVSGERMADDYYSTLGVPRDATAQDIKKAFRTIARECHPDIAGEDPAAADRFKVARTAYETLIDPVTRARYDRRGQRRSWSGPRGGSFFDAFYRNVAGGAEQSNGSPGERARQASGFGAHDAGGHAGSPRGKRNRHKPENDLDLDDLFRDFGEFGFGGDKRRTRTRTRSTGPTEPPPGPSGTPSAGADVHIELDVPAVVARDGGTVTAVYYRMQRADSWRPGAADPGVVRIQDIADVRIVPGTRDGAMLRERGLGDAGVYGGPYGDLVVRVRLVGRAEPRPPEPPPSGPRTRASRNAERPAPGSGPNAPGAEPARGTAPDDGVVTLDISVTEALLGGRVPLATPQGTVRLAIPPGTSSGTRLRLKGRGAPGADGQPSDLYVSVRIVVPRELDDASRKLIEEFAALNPGVPR